MDAERILAMAMDSEFGLGSGGMCLACNDEADGCEPDARNYECESCGEKQVFGASALLMMGYGI